MTKMESRCGEPRKPIAVNKRGLPERLGRLRDVTSQQEVKACRELGKRRAAERKETGLLR
jgi:hypothetical protein